MASREEAQVHDFDVDILTALDITCGPVIGRGMTGVVILINAKDCPSIKKVAKIFSLLTPDGGVRNKRLFETEIKAMEGLHHPYIIKHIFSVRCPQYLAIATDYCPNGTLTSKLNNLSFELCRKYFFQMASAVRYLNEKQRIVHNDIKPDNIFMDANNDAILGDFGLAFSIPPNATMVSTADMGGTLHFNALEKYVLSEVDPLKLDVYSLGMVLMCMLHKKLLTQDSLFALLLDVPGVMAIPEPLRLSMLYMIQIIPCDRCTMAQLLRMLRQMGYTTSGRHPMAGIKRKRTD